MRLGYHVSALAKKDWRGSKAEPPVRFQKRSLVLWLWLRVNASNLETWFGGLPTKRRNESSASRRAFDVHALHDILGELQAAEAGCHTGREDGFNQALFVTATIAFLVGRVAAPSEHGL